MTTEDGRIMLFAIALSTLAHADTIMLDTGATIDGDLARWEFGGDCQITVTEGGLVGAIVIVPCHRVQSFVRTEPRTPVPIGIEEPPAEELAPPPLEMHAELPAVAEAADVPVGAALVPPVEAEAAALVPPDAAELAPTALVDAHPRDEGGPVRAARPRYEDEPIIPADPIRAPDVSVAPAPLSTSGPTDLSGASRSVRF